MSSSHPSVYTSLGGRAAVERAVTVFYDRVSEDKRINKFFRTADMRRLRLKLAEFIVYAFGGPDEYAGRNLVDVHRPVIRKGATVYHFDIVAAHFMGTLADMGVAKELQMGVLGILLPVRTLFPNPWWRRLWHYLSRQRREKVAQDLESIAKAKTARSNSESLEIQAYAAHTF